MGMKLRRRTTISVLGFTVVLEVAPLFLPITPCERPRAITHAKPEPALKD